MNKKIIIGVMVLMAAASCGYCADSSGTAGLAFLKMGTGL